MAEEFVGYKRSNEMGKTQEFADMGLDPVSHFFFDLCVGSPLKLGTFRHLKDISLA